MDSETRGLVKIIATIAVVIFIFIGAGMYGCPQYNVWQQGLVGQAELRRAEQNRQIRVQEAHARLESAKLDAQSEVERAKGVSQANEIVAEGLGGPEGYLRYLFIQALQENAKHLGQVIYIPTEAGLPILEAGRGTQRPHQ